MTHSDPTTERERALDLGFSIASRIEMPNDTAHLVRIRAWVMHQIADLILEQRQAVAREIMDYAARDIERLYPRGPLVRWIRSRYLTPSEAQHAAMLDMEPGEPEER